jgi:crotonobetainyl-CoA:carnitine CoA-transferase CaiB-like acyl-CoA transferase
MRTRVCGVGSDEVSGALDGVHVLEFSQIAAGPYCGVNLSDLGADVVKVEPREGEHYRNVGAVVPGEGKRFQSLNRGKRAIAIDLKDQRGREVIHRLVPGFDVVLHNMRPGVTERLGIGYQALAELHPGLIYCEISAYGVDGPRGQDPATDGAMTAYTGLMSVIGKSDSEGTPQYTRPPIVDYATGLTSAMAIASALYHRERSGKGQMIQASMLRTALSLLDYHVMQEPVSDAATRDEMLAEIAEVRSSGGSYNEQMAIRERYRITEAGPPRLYYRSYQAKDGAVALGCLTPPTRAAVRLVLGVQDDSDSPDYDSTDPENEQRFIEWEAQISETMRSQTVEEWMERFEAAGVPASPVRFPEDLPDDPQVKALGLMWDLEHAVTGAQRVPGPTVQMSETPTKIYGPAPAYARDTDDVLHEHGFSDKEIASLHEANVIA